MNGVIVRPNVTAKKRHGSTRCTGIITDFNHLR
ncbi:hypothetical protein E2C01_067213 [Portunus trituberculatus]|uniref:Uncharacterized protein n=1 Tax=Portunus trituberculatus TaxID=210409 RepID=A0A5B7HKE0_PORTR|nr:hypothetical protein [Portunus trituberculatus]